MSVVTDVFNQFANPGPVMLKDNGIPAPAPPPAPPRMPGTPSNNLRGKITPAQMTAVRAAIKTMPNALSQINSLGLKGGAVRVPSTPGTIGPAPSGMQPGDTINTISSTGTPSDDNFPGVQPADDGSAPQSFMDKIKAKPGLFAGAALLGVAAIGTFIYVAVGGKK